MWIVIMKTKQKTKNKTNFYNFLENYSGEFWLFVIR